MLPFLLFSDGPPSLDIYLRTEGRGPDGLFETDEPAGLEHARDLAHGRDVAVAGNVLDSRRGTNFESLLPKTEYTPWGYLFSATLSPTGDLQTVQTGTRQNRQNGGGE